MSKLDDDETNSARNRYCIEPDEEGEMMSKIEKLKEDVLLEILSRLPVKTLLQVKSVCRRWNQIIDPSSNRPLVSLHLNNYYYKNKSSALIYELNEHTDEVPGTLSRFLEATVLQLEPDGDESRVQYLQPPMLVSSNVPSAVRIISGPCNGIYLLGYAEGRGELEYLMWNPATGSLRELPLLPGTDYDSANESFGFGVGTVADDDFKVVLILHSHLKAGVRRRGHRFFAKGQDGYSSPECPSRVLVYSLHTDNWTELNELRHDVEIAKSVGCYRFLNGFCFWLCVSPVAVLAFDMGKDVFRLINDPITVPLEMAHYHHGRKQLVIYKEDSLALFLNQTSNWQSMYDMWLLLKHEEEDKEWGWVKTFSIGPFVDRGVRTFSVLGSWEGGDDGKQKLILLVDPCLEGQCAIVLYDPEADAFKPILHYTKMRPRGIFAYKDSLVSLGQRSFPVCRSIRRWVFTRASNPPNPLYDCLVDNPARYVDWDGRSEFAYAFNGTTD